MINLGYTSGSQGKRMLGIAKNWLSKKAVDNEACKQQDLVDGGWLTLLWNVVLKNLPRVITASYDATIAEMSLPRMPTLRNDGYEVNLGDHRYHFTNGAQAPPSAVTAWNYAKYDHDALPGVLKADLFAQIHPHRHQCKRLHDLVDLPQQRRPSFWW